MLRKLLRTSSIFLIIGVLFGLTTFFGMPKPANDAQIVEQLKALNEQLKLTLPSGQEQQILVQLPLALQKISDYDPVPFKQRFEALAKLLPLE